MKKRVWYTISVMLVGLAASAFGGLPVTDGLIIHLDARSLSQAGLSEGDPVYFWADSTTDDGVDGSVSQITLVDPEHDSVTPVTYGVPTYKRVGYNGLPAVHFTRSTDFTDPANKQILVSENWSWTQTDGCTMFIVATGGGAGDARRAVQVGLRGGANGTGWAADLNSSLSGYRFGNGRQLADGCDEGVWHVSARNLGYNDTYENAKYFVGDSLLTFTDQGGNTNPMGYMANGNVISVGCGYHASPSHAFAWLDWYDGDITEVLVYNAVLSDSECYAVIDYLENKYLVAAHNPTPDNDVVNQGTQSGSNSVDVSLSWDAGMAPSNLAATNPNITDHYLYIQADDPNFVGVSPITIAAGGTGGSYGPITLSMDRTYYWRVDEAIDDSAPGDPNTIIGPTWAFDTLLSIPVIDVQPTDQVVAENGPATFDITVSSLSSPGYVWYHSDDATIDVPGDTSVGTAEDLAISNAASSDEGYYFCEITNDGGTVYTDVVTLGVKRKVAHWTLDQSDEASGQYLDSSGEGHHIDPNNPGSAQYIDGVDPTKTGDGLNVAAQVQSAGKTASWVPTFGTGEITVSAWVKWTGVWAETWAWQGLVNSRGSVSDPEGDVRNFLLEIEPGGLFRINAGGIILESIELPIDQWVHVAVSAGPDAFAIYVDGEEVAGQTPGAAIPQNAVPMYVGTLSRNANGSTNPFNGAIDDVRVYNYAKDKFAIADLYYEITEKPVCLNPNGVALALDVAGGGVAGDEPDCAVDLMDLATLAGAWLNCGYYPQTSCP